MDLYVSRAGDDQWTGALPEPNGDRTDGPLATVDGALKRLRSLQTIGGRQWQPHQRIASIDWPVTVHLRGGRYELDQPVTFRPGDPPLAMQPYRDEQPILSGGRAIGGWQPTTVNGVDAWVTTVPEVAAGQWYFKQLFVNGRRAARPRLPKRDFRTIEDICNHPDNRGRTGWGQKGTDHFVVAAGEFDPHWINPTDIHAVALHFWVDERMPIKSYDPATRTITSTRTSRAPVVLAWDAGNAPYFLENVFEAMTEPGEWYLDRPTGRCWYIPRRGETIDTVEAIAPRLHQLVRFAGDPASHRCVEHVRLRGLTFAHTAWAMPGDDDVDPALFDQIDRRSRGQEHYASGPQAAAVYPGAIQFRGARHCALEDCRIEHIGWYAVDIVEGCRHIRVVGNQIADLGCGGVKINGAAAAQPLRDDPGEPTDLRTGHCRVTDNHIHDGGQVFPAGIGILLRHAHANLIAHNHIHDFYYSAVSVGWVWGYGESVSRDNLIEHNHIHDLGKRWLSDMGGVYLLGVSPGTVVRGNLIHDINCRKYGGWAIYPDEGSAHVLIEHNVCYRTSSSVFHQHYGRENIVRNNIWAFGGEGIIALGKAADHISFTLTRNILLADDQPLYAGGHGWNVDDKRTIDSSLNVMWDLAAPGRVTPAANKPHGTASSSADGVVSWADWQAAGYDVKSIIADPKFADPRHGDFTLADNSPALELGFEPIDLSRVGPRPRDQRD